MDTHTQNAYANNDNNINNEVVMIYDDDDIGQIH